MSSFLNTQTPDIVKNRFTRNGLSSTSKTGHLQSTAATQKWNNQSFTSTPSGRNPNLNNSFENTSYQNNLSASMNAGTANQTIMSSHSQRYFADSHQRDRNDYQNRQGFEINQFSPFQGNNLSSQTINQYPGTQLQGPIDDQHRVYNTVLKNSNNYQLSSSTSTANFGRQQDISSLSGQSISQQINSQYLASKSVSHPVNSILNKGFNNATLINKQKQEENDINLHQQFKHQELFKNQRMISTMREQGFLQNQQNDILLKDGQIFVRSRKHLLDILIGVIVIIIAYTIYKVNSLLLNSRFSNYSEMKYVAALTISVVSKIVTFKHKIQVNSSFMIQTILGFCVDTLAIQYCINELITVFLVQKLNMDIRLNYKEYFVMALTLICSLFFYVNQRFIENNQIQNVNRQIRTIVQQTFSDIIHNILNLLKISLLPILIAYIGMSFNGERLSQLFLHKFDVHNNLTKSIITIYLLTLTQVILFKICSELVINLKSQYIWNFLSEIHDVHQIQHYYFVLADQKLNDDFIEIWNVFLRHGLFLKERFTNFKMNNFTTFESVYKLQQNIPKKFFQKIWFYLKHFNFYMSYLVAYYDLLYILDMVTYSVQNLTNCMVAYNHVREYSELFNSVYSNQTLSDYMVIIRCFRDTLVLFNIQIIFLLQQAVFQDLLELQGVFDKNQKLNQVYRQLLSNMSTLISITQDQKLFNATIRSILSNPDSFYSQN